MSKTCCIAGILEEEKVEPYMTYNYQVIPYEPYINHKTPTTLPIDVMSPVTVSRIRFRLFVGYYRTNSNEVLS